MAVAGLNPHAGENGLFGTEDAEQIAPAVAAARTRFNDTLKDGARAGGGRVRGLMRSALVVTEVALALILLAALRAVPFTACSRM